jgi:ATP-dependent phosphoenolpyruvate carboxykinase
MRVEGGGWSPATTADCAVCTSLVGIGVPDAVLNPRGTWSEGARHDQQAVMLARMFVKNFKNFETHLSKAVVKPGPVA